MTTVVHHSADFDGLFCREIARKFLPDAELIGWDYGDAKIPFPEGQVYVLDLSPDCFLDFDTAPKGQTRLIWIDHHKSALEKFEIQHKFGAGCRIDGVAACRLAWQWFTHVEKWQPEKFNRPNKQDFLDRKVSEPLAVRLAGEYDIWDKRDPNAELFQHGLKSVPLTDGIWEELLEPRNLPNLVGQLLDNGRSIQYSRDQEYRDVITKQGFDVQFDGRCYLACNSHELDIRSHLFEAGIKPHHDGLLGFTFNGKDWRVSLYGIPGKDIDHSKTAVKYGGGGHKGACGFRIDKLPFIP
jgi:oligoribonuclease NrnB/cAMP/cGMP phosphodiesterase (DHH superfamily)